ncbi:MAG: hypothetical protein ACOYLB_09850 [Phototrophicaceae bacterium]
MIFQHPQPRLNQFIQWGAMLLWWVMVLSVPLQVMLGLLIAYGGLLFITALTTLLLAPTVLLLTLATPPVQITPEGITLLPRVWQPQTIAWEQVSAFQVYPLLPQADQEVNRRHLVGRKNYRPAEGVMLIVPSLPLPYRILGFFVGSGDKGAVAFTNRTHTDYDGLHQLLVAHLGEPTPLAE